MKIIKEYIQKFIRAIKDGTAKSFLEETRWVYTYIRRYWKSMILYTVVGMLSTVISIAATYVSRDLVDIITGHKTGAVVKYFVLMILYGMISAVGVRNVVENQVDFTKSRNVIIAAMIMSLALGISFSSAGAIAFSIGSVSISLSGLAVASLVGILLNAILPGNDYVFGKSALGDTSVNFKV